MPDDRLPCPCCGHRTLTALDGYELCPVCFWEDDPRQSRDHDLVDGANGKSLAESRRTYARIGAMDEVFLAKVRPVRPSEAGDAAADPPGRVVRDEPRTSARFSQVAVITSAIKVGVVAAVPVALLIVLGPAFGQTLVGGASLGQPGKRLRRRATTGRCYPSSWWAQSSWACSSRWLPPWCGC